MDGCLLVCLPHQPPSSAICSGDCCAHVSPNIPPGSHQAPTILRQNSYSKRLKKSSVQGSAPSQGYVDGGGEGKWACVSLRLRENFLLLIREYSIAGQGHPLNEPYHLKHFLLQGNQFKQSAELAMLKFDQRGMLAPKAFWAIKSVMWLRALGSGVPSFLVNHRDVSLSPLLHLVSNPPAHRRVPPVSLPSRALV